jgi:hypothetical protein
VSKRLGSRLSLRPLARSAQVQESSGAGSEAGGRGGLEREALAVKNRTHFKHYIDRLDKDGEIFEHVGGVEDFALAMKLYEVAIERWPGERMSGAIETIWGDTG